MVELLLLVFILLTLGQAVPGHQRSNQKRHTELFLVKHFFSFYWPPSCNSSIWISLIWIGSALRLFASAKISSACLGDRTTNASKARSLFVRGVGVGNCFCFGNCGHFSLGLLTAIWAAPDRVGDTGAALAMVGVGFEGFGVESRFVHNVSANTRKHANAGIAIGQRNH